MTAHVPMARVPFAPLDNPRLQHLASAKNRQNGIIAQKSSLNGKASLSSGKTSITSTTACKRPLEPSSFNEFDSENIDPAAFSSPSKKSKGDAFDKPVKPFTFSLSTTKSMPPPPTIPSRLTTPLRGSLSSPKTPLTAPAGRSPKRKSVSNKVRRTSAPFTRIDPPFGSNTISTSLPFSLDAVLSGSLTSAKSKEVTTAGATIEESMPKSWFFDIHEDSPEEEAAIVMEHSTLTLDLSSDDESSRKARDDRGKENVPPEGFDETPVRRREDIVRKKVLKHDEMDDGLRSPMADLETEPFAPLEVEEVKLASIDESLVQASAAKSSLPLSTSAGKKVEEEIVIYEDNAVEETL